MSFADVQLAWQESRGHFQLYHNTQPSVNKFMALPLCHRWAGSSKGNERSFQIILKLAVASEKAWKGTLTSLSLSLFVTMLMTFVGPKQCRVLCTFAQWFRLLISFLFTMNTFLSFPGKRVFCLCNLIGHLSELGGNSICVPRQDRLSAVGF